MLRITSSGCSNEDALVRYQAGSPEKRKTVHLIYVLCNVKSLCYINRTSFTSYIGEPT